MSPAPGGINVDLRSSIQKNGRNSLTLGTLDILDHFSHSGDTRVNKPPLGASQSGALWTRTDSLLLSYGRIKLRAKMVVRHQKTSTYSDTDCTPPVKILPKFLISVAKCLEGL